MTPANVYLLVSGDDTEAYDTDGFAFSVEAAYTTRADAEQAMEQCASALPHRKFHVEERPLKTTFTPLRIEYRVERDVAERSRTHLTNAWIWHEWDKSDPSTSTPYVFNEGLNYTPTVVCAAGTDVEHLRRVVDSKVSELLSSGTPSWEGKPSWSETDWEDPPQPEARQAL